ncbi:unnamed protein product [Mytilus edulis]|uniref:Endonuclease/exonuclease/phosphatase domain-containing protein n=1 Tax=Mytilus edulis TaxID=6550 RepID=A0A8S3V8W9_MYTED|nr:unnamed protein product [Mytilus edulis]
MLFIAETKIDSSFPDAQFRVNDYHFWRADRNQNGGGLVAYARSDLVCDRKCNLEFNSVESICVDLFVNNRKWLITGLYRPPSMSNSEFSKDFIDTFDKASTKYDNILMLGDLNYDMLVNEKSNTLKDACDVCDLTNLVHEPTCHTKGNNPSLIDVVLTNKSSLCMNIRNFNTDYEKVKTCTVWYEKVKPTLYYMRRSKCFSLTGSKTRKLEMKTADTTEDVCTFVSSTSVAKFNDLYGGAHIQLGMQGVNTRHVIVERVDVNTREFTVISCTRNIRRRKSDVIRGSCKISWIKQIMIAFEALQMIDKRAMNDLAEYMLTKQVVKYKEGDSYLKLSLKSSEDVDIHF